MSKRNSFVLMSAILAVLILSACGSNVQVDNLNTETENESAPDSVENAENSQDPAPDSEGEIVDQGGEVSFENDVLPVFIENCQQCHGASGGQAGLVVTSYQELLAGSNNGIVILPGDADASRLIELIISGSMPKSKTPLTDEQIQIISDWVDQGALDN